MSNNPFDQFDTPTMATPADAQMVSAPQTQAQQPVQRAPQPSPAPQAANPFDQFDDHPHEPIPAPQSPQMMAQAPAPDDPNATARVVPQGFDPSRLEALRNDIGQLINSGGTRDQIDARARRDGLTADQLPGLDKALAYRDQGGAGAIPVGITAPDHPAPQDVHAPDKGRIAAGVTGAIDSLTLGGGDEAGGALDATGQSIANLLGFGNGKSWSDNYAASRDASRQDIADAQYYHPDLFLGGQLAGGALSIPLGGELSAGRAALEGAGYGGVYGFNSANGGIGDRLQQGAEGALLGGATGGIVGGVANRVARGIEANRATPSGGREILNAADRLNAGVADADKINPLVGHTSNGGVASTLHALAEPSIIAGSTGLRKSAQRFDDAGGMALQRIADNAAGGPVDNLTDVAARANDNTQGGTLGSYRDDSKQASNTIYNNAEQLAGDTQLGTPRTINAIDSKLAEWRQVPGGVAGQSALEDLREQLANGTFTVAGLRRLRTSFGDNIDAGNRTVKEAANTLWGPLSQDITQGLRSAGKSDAANAYRSADRNYSQRMTNLDAVAKVIGKDGDLSADAVATRLSNMSRNDYDRLGVALNAIDPNTANEIRGGLIHNLGQAKAGQATEPNQFSFDTFATNWNKLSDQAKSATFQPSTIRDLNDLATLAGARRSVNKLANSSRSGTALENYSQLQKVGELAALSGGGGAGLVTGAAAAHPFGLITSLALPAIGGHILGRPGVARALLKLGENGNVAIAARRLSEAARRNPAAEQDILGLRDQLAANPNTVTVPESPPQP